MVGGRSEQSRAEEVRAGGLMVALFRSVLYNLSFLFQFFRSPIFFPVFLFPPLCFSCSPLFFSLLSLCPSLCLGLSSFSSSILGLLCLFLFFPFFLRLCLPPSFPVSLSFSLSFFCHSSPPFLLPFLPHFFFLFLSFLMFFVHSLSLSFFSFFFLLGFPSFPFFLVLASLRFSGSKQREGPKSPQSTQAKKARNYPESEIPKKGRKSTSPRIDHLRWR